MVILLVMILGFTIGILRHFIRKGSYGLWNAAMHDKNSADNNMIDGVLKVKVIK